MTTPHQFSAAGADLTRYRNANFALQCVFRFYPLWASLFPFYRSEYIKAPSKRLSAAVPSPTPSVFIQKLDSVTRTIALSRPRLSLQPFPCVRVMVQGAAAL